MKSKKLESLKLLYLFIFIVSAILVVPAHLFRPPAFMYARFPHYLEMMKPFLGIAWPMTFEIYHYGLYALALIGGLNVFGILFYPRFKNVTIFSSLMGLFLIPPMILFFFFVFLSVNVSTAVIYGLYLVLLLIVDLLTFKTFIKKQKVA